jgi:hypothetical protein
MMRRRLTVFDTSNAARQWRRAEGIRIGLKRNPAVHCIRLVRSGGSFVSSAGLLQLIQDGIQSPALLLPLFKDLVHALLLLFGLRLLPICAFGLSFGVIHLDLCLLHLRLPLLRRAGALVIVTAAGKETAAKHEKEYDLHSDVSEQYVWPEVGWERPRSFGVRLFIQGSW